MPGDKPAETISYGVLPLDEPFEGERFTPGVGGEMELEHVHRYLAVRDLCRRKRVLDIASGQGYGAALLAQVADAVTGVEIDPQTVDRAGEVYTASNLQFVCGNATDIPLDDNSVDVVVSFETLEHLEAHRELMLEIRRVLASDGVLVMSTPDKDIYGEVSGGVPNPFHVAELTASEFNDLLRSFFNNVAYFGQRVVLASTLFGVEAGNNGRGFFRISEDRTVITAEKDLQKPVYIVAAASNGPLPELPEGLLEGPIWINPLSTLTGGVKDRDDQITALQEALDELSERTEEIQARNSILERRLSRLPGFLIRFFDQGGNTA